VKWKKLARKTILKLYSSQFQKQLLSTINSYGDGDSVGKIIEVLLSPPLKNLIKKKFFDVKTN